MDENVDAIAVEHRPKGHDGALVPHDVTFTVVPSATSAAVDPHQPVVRPNGLDDCCTASQRTNR
jgi:hypothetical protein